MAYWKTPLHFHPGVDNIFDKNEKHVATVMVGMNHADEQVAMGYVLAAGPEMFDALIKAQEYIERTEIPASLEMSARHFEASDAVRRAIDKAIAKAGAA